MIILKALLIGLFYGVIGFTLAQNDITPNKLSYWLIIISVAAVHLIASLWS